MDKFLENRNGIITLKKVAERFGVDAGTIEQVMKENDIPCLYNSHDELVQFYRGVTKHTEQNDNGDTVISLQNGVVLTIEKQGLKTFSEDLVEQIGMALGHSLNESNE